MKRLKTRLQRFEPPVPYEDVRPWLQRVRVVAASAIALASVVAVSVGWSEAVVPGVVAAVVGLHALLRGRRSGSATESLVVDAVAIAIGAGVAQSAQVVLLAGMAHFLAASITFGGLSSLFYTLAAFGTAVAVRPYLPIPSPVELPLIGAVLVWVAAGVLLAATSLAHIAAASAVFQARRSQRGALAEARRASELKTEFVSLVTHELRTPLTNIAGFALTLQDTWKTLEPEEADEFLKIIVSESEHLTNLVDDVLAIPRLEAGRLLLDVTEFNLQPAAYKIADLIFPAGGERSASVSIGGNVWVKADPNRVGQVLRNLLENARKYGGEQVSVEATRHGDEWMVVVADNGSGIALEHRQRIFGSFEQVSSGDKRTESGFGLGLSVAKHLVEAMGGRIWYEPGFPVGARFCFTLPATKARAKTTAEVA